jgi:cyclic pyranopterin phosphate synthase
MAQLTHFDEKGRSRMVDVSEKGVTLREAVAQGTISMKAETFAMIMHKKMKKGDVFEVARLAGIMAAKRTFELIPLCHPLNLTSVEVSFHPDAKKNQVKIESRVKVEAKTGVEMEALIAVSVAALTMYDMCKAVDRGMVISDIKLFRKSGGKSGVYQAEM